MYSKAMYTPPTESSTEHPFCQQYGLFEVENLNNFNQHLKEGGGRDGSKYFLCVFAFGE